MTDVLAITQGDGGIRACSVTPQAAANRPNTWAAVPGVTSLEDSGSEAWDFEPLSPSCSSSSSSEIPEAILEESSDEDRRPNQHSRLDSDGWGCDTTEISFGSRSPALTKPVLISAWTSAWMAGPPVSARETSTSLGDSAPGSLTSGAARTPVRRARVRGTLLLPTSSRELQNTDDIQQQTASRNALVRSTTAPLLQPVPLNTLSRGLNRNGGGQIGARRAEEALQAELDRQAHEAADRQAILKALNDDRAVLAMSEKQAQAELTRVQAELARVQAELSLRIAEVWDLKDTQDMLQCALSRSPLKGVCVCCLDAPATMAPVPCGHLALCEACVLRLDSCNCPVCRQPSDCIIHIFTP